MIFFKYLDKGELMNYLNNIKNENIKKDEIIKGDELENENINPKDAIKDEEDFEKDNNSIINIINAEILEDKNKEGNNNNMQILKNNLTEYLIKDYFKKQCEKYNLIFNKQYSAENLYTLINANLLKNTSLLKYEISKTNFPLVYEIYSNLKKILENINNNYPGEEIFGFVFVNKKEYFYTYHNDDII